MSQDISPELVERMVALVRQCAGQPLHGQALHDVDVEAQSIVAQLPEPIDPDLMEARQIAAFHAGAARDGTMNGEWDNSLYVQNALKGIKRGRELASLSQPGVGNNGQ